MTGWDEAALQSLIDGKIQERHDLEYKAAEAFAKTDGKKREITIDVSAMANAAGGTMIFGMTEDGDHYPERLDLVDPQDFPKEWVEQVINSIEPRIQGIDIQPIAIAGASGVVYAVEVLQGVTVHQALDGRYYRRYNFQRLSMRHHEVVDVMNRAKVPDLALDIGYQTLAMTGERHDYMLKLKICNDAMVTALHYKLEIEFPQPVFEGRVTACTTPGGPARELGLVSTHADGDSITFVYRSRRPVYPKDEDDITNDLDIHYAVDNKSYEVIHSTNPDVQWRLYADNATPRTGRVRALDLSKF